MTLSDYINANRLTVDEFAERVNYTRQYIHALMARKQRTSMEAAIRIHRATDGHVTFADLMGTEPTPVEPVAAV